MASGDPATQMWQQAIGDLQAKLAASQADLTRAEQDRAEAVEKCGELGRELAIASHSLSLAQQGDNCAWRAAAARLRTENDRLAAQLDAAQGRPEPEGEPPC